MISFFVLCANQSQVTLKALVGLTCIGLLISNSVTIYSNTTADQVAILNDDLELVNYRIRQVEAENNVHGREIGLIKKEQKTLMYNSSCYEIWLYGETADGVYLIQPNENLAPFQVECNFLNDTAWTIISHEHSQRLLYLEST